MAVLEDIVLQSPALYILLGTVILLLLLLFFSNRSNFEKHGKEPPGPRALPLLGNLLTLDRRLPYRTFSELYRQFGSVFKFYLGPRKVVVLAGTRTIRNALLNNGEAFAARYIHPIIKELDITHGILFNNGDSWKEMRRFALSSMRDFGMGKKACEEKIIEECQHLIDVFKKKEGKACETTEPVSNAISNIICSIVYGNRFEYEDQEFTTMVKRANENARLVSSPSMQLYAMFPRLCKWIRDRKRLMENIAANKRQITKLIKSLQDTLSPQLCRCVVDSFLSRKKHLEESGDNNSHYNDDNLLVTVANLFTAGTDTTSTTIRFGLLFMAKYPEIQGLEAFNLLWQQGFYFIPTSHSPDQVQEELIRVIGSRQVRAEDRKNLPYTDAVIHETQRLANITPVLENCTASDVTFQGFFIKKGTPVFILLSSVLQDESEWENPGMFYPAHFLDKTGQFVRRDAFMPFSAGQRACVGESLARMELFLFFTSLLQHFRFTPPPGVTEDELDLTPVQGLVLSPTPHKLCAISCI